MIEMDVILANPSKVKILGRFAKSPRTWKNQYFFNFVARNGKQSSNKTHQLPEVCQNVAWNAFLLWVLACAVSIN
jgi:hypothetical protein